MQTITDQVRNQSKTLTLVYIYIYILGMGNILILYRYRDMRQDIVLDFGYCNIAICHQNCLLLVLNAASQ